MKPFTLLLILAFISVVLSSGCLENAAPQKKVVTPPVTTKNPEIPLTPVPTSTSSSVIMGTPIPAPVITTVFTVASTDVMGTETQFESPSLKILKSVEVRPEVGKLTITGIAKNEGKTSVPRAEVQIKFFDANNNLITSSKATTDNFDAGGTWEFTMEYPGPDSRKVYSYKITVTPV
ncbi:MAG: FxLYD domain-containing protein [Methanomicrobiales archaeon]